MSNLQKVLPFDMPGEVLYLTGAPATGKTSLARLLVERAGYEMFSYGSELTHLLKDTVQSQDVLRAQSARLISPRLVQELDDALIARAQVAHEQAQRLVIDSHAVTREAFGFRAVPYSAAKIGEYGITHIAYLYIEPEVIADRILSDPGGRPLPSKAELRRHNELQAVVATTYAHTLGVPVGYFNSDIGREELAEAVLTFCDQ